MSTELEELPKSTGKNYACNQKEELRNEKDYYPTHYSLTQQFLARFKIPKSAKILEPATGKAKAIESVLVAEGYKNVTGKDLETGDDFLKSSESTDWVVTNAPFKLFTQFVIKSLKVAKKGVAILGKVDFLTGGARFEELYNIGYPPTIIYVFVRKPFLDGSLREDGKYKTAIDGYCWFVWDLRKPPQDPIIKWIDNREFVLRVRKPKPKQANLLKLLETDKLKPRKLNSKKRFKLGGSKKDA